MKSITLGHLRSEGCRRLLVYCGRTNELCHHHESIDADRWPDETPVRSLDAKMVCTKCGTIGAEVRPDWTSHMRHQN